MIQVDLRSRIPIYEQLYENIRRLILQGLLEEDVKLPSVRELASDLAINPNTIQKAYKALEQDGYIYSNAGRGSFVAKVMQNILDNEKESALAKVKAAVEESMLVSVSEEMVVDLVRQCYNKEENHD